MPEPSILKYRKLVEAVLDKKPLKKVNLTTDDAYFIQEITADYYNLASFDGSNYQRDRQIVSDMFLKNEFYLRKIEVGSPQYLQFFSDMPEVRVLKDGETLEIAPIVKEHADVYQPYYLYTRTGQFIIESARLPLPSELSIKKSKMEAIASIRNATDAWLRVDNKIFYEDGINNIKTCVIDDDENYCTMLPYDDRKNIFRDSHVLVFDSNGQQKDLRKTNLVKLLHDIRTADAHDRMCEFEIQELYGAKVFQLFSGGVAVVSSSWYSFLSQVLGIKSYIGYGDNYKFVYIPTSDKSIRNSAQLKELLSQIKIVNISLPIEVDLDVLYSKVSNIMNLYANAKNVKSSLSNFITEKLYPQFIISDISVTDIDPSMLYVLLSNNKDFYNIESHEDKNLKKQSYLIRWLISKVYNYKIVNSKNISKGGKFGEIPIDISSFIDFYTSDKRNAFSLFIRDIKAEKDYAFCKNERYVALCAICAYNALVGNGFCEELVKNQIGSTNFVKNGENQNYNIMLSGLDVSKFERRNIKTGEVKKIQTVEDKVALLRAIRNCISHNNMQIKFNKSGNYKDNYLVFSLEKTKINNYIRAEDFLDFVTQPLFVNFSRKKIEEIKADSFEDLNAKIKLLCKDYSAVQNESNDASGDDYGC